MLGIAEPGEFDGLGNVHRRTRIARRVASSHCSLRLMFTPWPAKYKINWSTPAPLVMASMAAKICRASLFPQRQ